ncbi:restriction endonuclease [Streptomyces sp. NBC_00885]|uniref:nSTAND3 domain-containing NTPase n=1 Tax=Streptomyces sp. NBC_00885 TaxID=2975857 RepID=UPI00386B24DF|nr:restriction endonuclease [Streptomyces sp. NBC_00885]
MTSSHSARYPGEAFARPSYRLHTLGWRAFEDLALAIMREILGPTVVSFAEGGDGGRDGAFYGDWEPDTKAPMPFGGPGASRLTGPFVIQCKFVQNESDTLKPSDVSGEVKKVSKLVADGICSTYVLMTNARVTAGSERVMRDMFQAAGAKHALVLSGTWIQEMITSSVSLRRNIPRVYGLGDLTQILDERRYSQAHAFLSHLGDESLATFARTKFYAQAMDYLDNRGFTILVGGAGSGKSISAAALAMGIVDAYGSAAIKVDAPEEFKDSWNPQEPDQLFWVDDAFGVYRFDARSTEKWVRNYGLMQTAIKNGARFIFTSRDYILEAARYEFKGTARELLDCHVDLSPHDLTLREREQIIYNHLRYGDQPKSFLTEIKDHLPAAARSTSFTPEQARRLGSTHLSSGLESGSERQLLDFFENPIDHLCEVLRGLDQDSLSALCLVYMAGGGLKSPLAFTSREVEVLDLVGGTKAGVTQALSRWKDSFLLRVNTRTSPQWKFYHPSLAHALAKHIGQNAELVEIFISGLTERALFTIVDCGGQKDVSRETVTIPEVCYDLLINRISELQDSHLLCESPGFVEFLSSCCSEVFLLRLAELRGSIVGKFTNTGTLRFGASGIKLLARLYRAGLLSEEERRSAVSKIIESAASIPDLEVDFDWAETSATAELATVDEYRELREGVFRAVIPELADVIEDPGSTIEWESEEDWLQVTQHYEAAVRAYRSAYEDHPDASAELEYTEDVLRTYLYSSPMCGGGFDEEESEAADDDTGSRSIFDDLDSV